MKEKMKKKEKMFEMELNEMERHGRRWKMEGEEGIKEEGGYSSSSSVMSTCD